MTSDTRPLRTVYADPEPSGFGRREGFVNAEDTAFNPLQTITFVMPELGVGTTRLRLHNRGTGFVSDELGLDVGPIGSGSSQAWAGLLDQLTTAVERLTAGRPDAAQLANTRLAALAQLDSSAAAAMAANSGLVSAANLTTLNGIGPGSYTPAQRVVVRRHALLLDAIASSAGGSGGAAELARLTRKQQKNAQEIQRARAKLDNPNFVRNAPAEVVATERERIAQFEKVNESLARQIEIVQGLVRH